MVTVDDAIVVVENVERLMEESAFTGAKPRGRPCRKSPCHRGYHACAHGGVYPMGFAEDQLGDHLSTILYFNGHFHFVIGLSGADADTRALCLRYSNPHEANKERAEICDPV